MISNKRKVSVVLSFYNEANVIPELIQRLRNVFKKLISHKRLDSYELIFVNDCSKDDSEQIIKNHMGMDDIVLVNMTRNFGVSECVMAGFRQASGDAVVYMDADLQDPPEVISEMVARWQDEDSVDVVYTTRRKRAGEHPLKMWITKWGYRLINKISDIELPVDSGDFKLLSRRAVNHIIQLKEDKPYIRGLVSWVGYKQVQIMYDRDPRFDGRENTKMPVMSRRVIYYWLDRALISFSDAPLKLILFMGFVISGISIAYLSVIFIQKILGWYTPGWPALMSAILFLGGIQMLMLGFVGLYVGAIFREIKDRPQYLLNDVLKG